MHLIKLSIICWIVALATTFKCCRTGTWDKWGPLASGAVASALLGSWIAYVDHGVKLSYAAAPAWVGLGLWILIIGKVGNKNG